MGWPRAETVECAERGARPRRPVQRRTRGHERVAITRNGKLAAAVIGPEDLELLEDLEMAADVAEYRRAVADDDGERVSLSELRRDIGG